jgi:SAM-dependent methyltransferase
MVEAARAAAIAGAWQTGLFARLLAGPPAEHDALAAELGIDAEASRLVLEALAAYGYTEHDGSGWRAAPWLATATARSPRGLAGMATLFAGLPKWLATGVVAPEFRGDPSPAYREITPQLGRMFADAATSLADAIGTVDGTVLDVGAGSAVWGLAMIERSPSGRVVALDMPPVLEAARAWASARGLADRLDTWAGSYWDVPITPGSFDRVLIANVLHLETPEAAERLVRRFAEAVRPGGDLVVVDVLGEDPSVRALRASYALHLRLRRAVSFVPLESQVASWLASAGCSPVASIALDSFMPGQAALVGRRG